MRTQEEISEEIRQASTESWIDVTDSMPFLAELDKDMDGLLEQCFRIGFGKGGQFQTAKSLEILKKRT